MDGGRGLGEEKQWTVELLEVKREARRGEKRGEIDISKLRMLYSIVLSRTADAFINLYKTGQGVSPLSAVDAHPYTA